MLRWIINALIIFGSALMIVNIIGFIKYAVFVKGRQKWGKGRGILYVPIVLLCLFFFGYMAVWIFGSPDMIIAGILSGGSVFVFIMMILLNRITKTIIKSEQLEARLLAAEESNRMKNSFLASISHEMRTPLNVILGLDELAQKRDDIPAVTRIQLEKIENSGKHLLGLINNILEMQNTDAEIQKFKNEEFYLHNIVNQIGAMIGTMCEDKGLKFFSVIDENAQDRLLGDELLLKQILLSILDNAVKYTCAPGTVTLKIKQIVTNKESCVLRFIVEDTGIGISEEFLPNVFDLFSQEDASFTNQYGGSGVGLALTKQRIELMNGTVAATSTLGVGSVFTVTIPFGISKADSTADKSHILSSNEKTSLAGKRILIVEDVDENAEIVADLLELEEAETELAKNGSVALDMVKSSDSGYYDAILMDLRMPVMDGIESAKNIRKLKREDTESIPIIALTANDSDEDIKKSAEAGINAHLVKPINSDILYQTLRDLIK